MEIRIYAFDFEKAVKGKGDYYHIDFKQYAERCIYELGCRSFMCFNNLPSNTNVKQFIDATCMNLFGLVRSFFLQKEEADVMVAYRVVDVKHNIDKVVECL